MTEALNAPPFLNEFDLDFPVTNTVKKSPETTRTSIPYIQLHIPLFTPSVIMEESVVFESNCLSLNPQ